jgi:hypothetical protein
MKAKIATVFITILIFSGIIVDGLITQLELNQIEGTFKDMVNFMYMVPFLTAYVAANLTYKFSLKPTGE